MRKTNYNEVLDEVLSEVTAAAEASTKVASAEPMTELAQDLLKVAEHLRNLDDVDDESAITLDDVREYLQGIYGS